MLSSSGNVCSGSSNGPVVAPENSPAGPFAVLGLGDPDDWTLGHGPPFAFALAPDNPPHVARAVRVVARPGE